ncbi:NAD-dependent protein deacetylase [Lysobacter olei]
MATPAPAPLDPAHQLAAWMDQHRNVFVLTGAGCSTGSGIPDYRDEDGAWKRKPPVTYQAFVQDPLTRARYWARSFIGWPHIADARPNATHLALAHWQAEGGIRALVTQNVDGLHQRAGSAEVVDLHGRLDEVVCLDCRERTPRERLQRRLDGHNPNWRHLTAATAPDGDADLELADFHRFRVPDCEACGGLLKPDVVFYGENVPRDRVSAAQQALANADAMLVVGSSLMVYSGYRFARMAREAGLPLAILTRGVTRADDLATLKLAADCADTLPRALRMRN